MSKGGREEKGISFKQMPFSSFILSRSEGEENTGKASDKEAKNRGKEKKEGDKGKERKETNESDKEEEKGTEFQ